LVSELPEQSTLQGFGHEVSDHVSSQTPDQRYITLVDASGNKEIPNINVLCMLAAQSFSILLQKNCALVVLEQNIVLNLVSLGFHEVSSPTDRWHEVVGTYDFRFRSASSIELLLGQTHNGKSSSQR
jgi:hypothetical protein